MTSEPGRRLLPRGRRHVDVLRPARSHLVTSKRSPTRRTSRPRSRVSPAPADVTPASTRSPTPPRLRAMQAPTAPRSAWRLHRPSPSRRRANNGRPKPGQQIKYTITVKNTGSAGGALPCRRLRRQPGSLAPGLRSGRWRMHRSRVGQRGVHVPDRDDPGRRQADVHVQGHAAALSFDGESGGGGSEPGSFPIENTATLDGETAATMSPSVSRHHLISR